MHTPSKEITSAGYSWWQFTAACKSLQICAKVPSFKRDSVPIPYGSQEKAAAWEACYAAPIRQGHGLVEQHGPATLGALGWQVWHLSTCDPKQSSVWGRLAECLMLALGLATGLDTWLRMSACQLMSCFTELHGSESAANRSQPSDNVRDLILSFRSQPARTTDHSDSK